MISIITPFYRKDYLKKVYESIKNQTYQDWQWVLVPNNDGLKLNLSEFTDKRIKIVPYKEKTKHIGKIKHFAFNQGDGEWLLELDHDDLLLPTALEELSKVEKEFDFAYSNTAEFKENWESPKYNLDYGWQYREIEYEGHKLNEAITWDPTPQSISLIYYAPNHFRAWRKEFYQRIGGHNESYEICDDHELVIRTYLEGKMFHIDKCLYLYRIHGDNEWLLRNQKIQELTHQLYNQYIYKLVEKWCDINKLRKIDLGGRFNCPIGWESVDLKNADIIMNLDKKWKFKDNSIGVIKATDFLEHLKDKQFTIKEIHRVLVPNGWLLSMTPSTDGRGAFQDPTHKTYYNQNSFYYYTKKELAKYIDNKDIRFQVSQLETAYPNKWTIDNKIPYVAANLIKLGKDRLPGLCEI